MKQLFNNFILIQDKVTLAIAQAIGDEININKPPVIFYK